MLLQIGKLLATGYLLLLTVAAGGLVGANVAGFIAGAVQFLTLTNTAPDPSALRPWVHGGWILGAALFFLGAARRICRLWSRSSPQKESNTEGTPEGKRSQPSGFRCAVGSRPCGVVGSFGVGGLIGGFLGLLLGGSFLLLWFSVVYSPLAPNDWVGSIKVERIGMETLEEEGLTTSHPVAMYVFFVPLACGATLGALLCAFGTAVQNWKDEKQRQSANDV